MPRLLLLFLCVFPWMLFSQETSWKQVHRIESGPQKCFVDQLNRVYLVKKGEIVLYDENFKQLSIYSNKLIGESIQVDVSNPLKVVIYSADQLRLIFLDSRLAELKEPINLFRMGYEQVSLCASSYNNGVWLYDPINFQLTRYDQNMEVMHKSLNLGQMLRLELNPTSMVERNNKLYMIDPEYGLLVFDVYANFINRYPMKDIENLVVNDGHLYFQKAGTVYALDLLDMHEEEVPLKFENIHFFDVNRSRIVAAEPNGLLIFTTLK